MQSRYEELREAAQREAERRGITAAELIRQALAFYIGWSAAERERKGESTGREERT